MTTTPAAGAVAHAASELSGLLGTLPEHIRLGDLTSHLLVDLVALGLLTGVAYRRQRRNSEMVFTLSALNVGLFMTLVAISGDAFSTGAGFGLFGMLSLIRLRSASFTTVDMGYSFVALVLGLVMGILGLPLVLCGGVAVALLALVFVGDHPRLNPATQTIVMVLDRAHPSPAAARRDVVARIHLPVMSVSIDEVDYVREVTKVTVTCGNAVAAPVPPQGGEPVARRHRPIGAPVPARAATGVMPGGRP